MSPDELKLALVIAGGLIALFSSLLTAWVTSRLSERKSRNDRLEKFHGMLGRRRAMLRGESSEEEETTAVIRRWLAECGADQARVAFMIGYLEKHNAQLEASTEETARLKADNAISRSDIAALNREHTRLAADLAALKSGLN